VAPTFVFVAGYLAIWLLSGVAATAAQYGLGCCWVLMGLLFVGGVMNLLWIAAIAVFILLEKTIPFAEVGGRVVGAALIVIGLLSLAGAVALG
jgi:predicted metal-binding membrane protein